MKRITAPLLLLVPLVACQSAASIRAARADSLLTVERVVSDSSLRYRGAGSRTWLAGSEYAVVDDEGLGAVDARSGERRSVVAADSLVPEGADEPLAVKSWVLSDDGARALLYTNTARVWRLETRGDYWVVDTDGGEPRQLGADFEESTLMFAK